MYPLVSVCVASYNQADFVCATLDSIVAQSYRNIELIIVDDCSKDNSVAIINDWLNRYNSTNKQNKLNIQFYAKEINSGVCATFNLALQKSKGKYINIIGTDDIMLPEKISKQVALLERSSDDVGLVYSDAYLMDSKGDCLFGKFIQLHRSRIINIAQDDVFDMLIEGNFIPIMSVLWKKKCFDMCGGFDEALIYEDYDMLLRVALRYEFIFSDFTSVKYRLHNSNSHNRLRSLTGLESDFRIFYKHANVSNKIRSIVNIRLMQCVENMSFYKSTKFREYLTLYNNKFPENKTASISLAFHLPYKWLIGIHNLIKVAKKYFF
jgi:glycosyltransferase involved in cell wall biosynthesis